MGGEQIQELISTHLNYFRHLLDVYHAVSVHVIHPECPFQLLFRRTAGRHVDGQQKFLQRDMRAWKIVIIIITNG